MLFLGPNNHDSPVQTEDTGGLYKIDGDPWYIDSEVMYFPATKILVFSSDLRRWYHHGKIDPDCYLEEFEYKAYNLNYCDSALEAIKVLSSDQQQKGKNDIKARFKELMYVYDK